MSIADILTFLKKHPKQFFCVKDIEENSPLSYAQITQSFYVICKKNDYNVFRKRNEVYTPSLYPILRVKYLLKNGGITRYIGYFG